MNRCSFSIDFARLSVCEYCTCVSICSVGVMQHYTLWILLIENSVRMHRVAPGRKVLQVDHNDVVDLSSQDGPQEAQPGGSGGQEAVRGVCVLSEHGLLINTANTVGSSFQEYSRMPEIDVETEKWLKRRRRQPLILICWSCLRVKVRLLSYYIVQDYTMTRSFISLSCYIHIIKKRSMNNKIWAV